MTAVVGALAWEFQVSLPLLTENTFHGGAGTYGTMTSVMGVGAVVGGLFSASRPSPGARGLALAAIGGGAAITVAALAPTLPVEYVALLFVGYGSISFNSLAKTTLQLATAPVMLGRVMALWGLAWQGSTPIGGPISGWISDEFGPRWSLLAGGSAHDHGGIARRAGAVPIGPSASGRRHESGSHGTDCHVLIGEPGPVVGEKRSAGKRARGDESLERRPGVPGEGGRDGGPL